MRGQVLERIKDPLMTLVSRDHHETAYAVLAHFLIIAQRAPLIFASVRPAPLRHTLAGSRTAPLFVLKDHHGKVAAVLQRRVIAVIGLNNP